MPQTVQVGSILVKKSLPMPDVVGVDIEHYSENWNLIRNLDGFELDRKLHGSRWNFFFMAEEVKTTFAGSPGAKKIENALHRILGKVTRQAFNALEVTQILTKRFLGVPYTVVSAHSRHIQQSCYLYDKEEQSTSPISTTNRSALERDLRFRSAMVS